MFLTKKLFNMSSFSKEEQDQIYDTRKKKEHRDMLNAARDRILQGIANNKTRSGERAIWELMQNARDFSEHAEVVISLDNKSFTFAHKGENFTQDTLSSLIKQQSSKHHDPNQVGQYGTGFMTTHVFSKKVYISGDVFVEFAGKQFYIPLPDDFCLDRSLEDENKFADEMDKELELVDHLQEYNGADTSQLPTTFRYDLQENKLEKVSQQLDTAMKLMPFVIAFNDRIEKCEICNKISKSNVIYSRNDKVVVDSSDNWELVKYGISVESKGTSVINLYCLEDKTHLDRIIIPILPVGFNDTAKIPSQFLFFPLLGTENFGTNFIFHSARLYPVEKRDSYLLPCDNDDMSKKFNTNKAVLDKMFEMLFSYYRLNSAKQYIPLDFAMVNFNYTGDEKRTKEYFEELQVKFSAEFITWKMIPAEGTFHSIDSKELVVLSHEIYASLDDEAVDTYIPIVSEYARQVKKIPSKDVLQWSKIVYQWMPDNTEYYVTIDDICAGIKNKGENLHTLLMFISTLGNAGKEIINRYNIIPNRKGKLCSFKLLKDAINIDDDLYQLCKPILGSNADKILDLAYNDVSDFPEYSLTDLKKDVKDVIDEVRKTTIDYKIGNLPHPLCIDEIDDEKKPFTVAELINFCMIFWTEDPSNSRSRLMKVICDIYKVSFKVKFMKQDTSDSVDYSLSAFNFLLDNTLVMLSKTEEGWLGKENHKQLLLSFLEEYTKGKDDNRTKRLDTYGVIPNQKGYLCIAKELKINHENEITDDLQKIYKNVKRVNLQEVFVDDDFKGICQFEEYTGKSVGNEIERVLQENKYEGDDALLILKNLTHKEWTEFFPNMNNQIQDIYWSHGSDEVKDALFAIQMKGENNVKRMAALALSKNFDAILEKAENLFEKQKEQECQFNFTFAIGKLIEDVVRDKVDSELSCTFSQDVDTFSADDVQNGQDIIIYKNGEPVYYMECKAKWNFNDQAHMSSNQIKKAFTEKGHYALCCIDCTADTGCRVAPNATKEQVYDAKLEILNHAYIQDKVDELVNADLNPLIKQENDTTVDEKKTIKVYSSLSSNISKEVFTSGKLFSEFVQELINKLK